MEIGHKIKKVREIKGYTREYMAAQLEMSVSNYGKLERDEIPITLEKLKLISESLGVNYQDILSFDEKQVFNFIQNDNSKGYNIYQQNIYNSHEIAQKLNEMESRMRELEKLLSNKQG